MDLTTITRVKKFFPIQGNKSTLQTLNDSIELFITGVSKEIEKYLDRVIEKDTYTKWFDIDSSGQKKFRVNAFPIESVSLLEYNAEDITECVKFAVDGDEGYFNVDACLYKGFEKLRIDFIGGMATDTDDFINNFPDIEKACIMQVVFETQRTKNLTASNASFSSTDKEYNSYQLQPAVKNLLNKYKNRTFVT